MYKIKSILHLIVLVIISTDMQEHVCAYMKYSRDTYIPYIHVLFPNTCMYNKEKSTTEYMFLFIFIPIYIYMHAVVKCKSIRDNGHTYIHT